MFMAKICISIHKLKNKDVILRATSSTTSFNVINNVLPAFYHTYVTRNICLYFFLKTTSFLSMSNRFETCKHIIISFRFVLPKNRSFTTTFLFGNIRIFCCFLKCNACVKTLYTPLE